MTSISIIIPAYNEEKTIGQALKKISAYLEQKKCDYEIIVVDDGSADRTLEIAKKFPSSKIRVLENRVNRGKGYAVKQGVLEARKDWILFADADLATPIEELKNFLRFQNYDVVIASRALKDSKIISHQSKFREFGGRVINFFVRLLLLPGIWDTQCGFKLFRKQAAQKIFNKLTIDRFGFDIEALYLARKYGFTIKELPVTWSHQPNTKVRPIKDGLKILWDLVKIKINNLRGLYN